MRAALEWRHDNQLHHDDQPILRTIHYKSAATDPQNLMIRAEMCQHKACGNGRPCADVQTELAYRITRVSVSRLSESAIARIHGAADGRDRNNLAHKSASLLYSFSVVIRYPCNSSTTPSRHLAVTGSAVSPLLMQFSVTASIIVE